MDVLAILATESQVCSPRINAQHFMRSAVIVRKGINTVSPRVGPVILGKAFLENRRRIFRVGEQVPADKITRVGDYLGKYRRLRNSIALVERHLVVGSLVAFSIKGNERRVEAGLVGARFSTTVSRML